MFKQFTFLVAAICAGCVGNQLFAQKGEEAKGGQELDRAYLECQYRFTYAKDTLKPDVRKEDRMVLLLGRQASRFHSYRTFLADSIMQVDINAGVNTAQMLANVEKYKGGESEIIYKYDGKVVVTDKIFRDYFKVEEEQPAFDWVIAEENGNERAEVLGYSCRKATCTFRGRDYVAWFTPDMPISNGPWKFAGLPGLILKIADTRNHYEWEMVGIRNVSDRPILMEQRQFINTSREKFAKTKQRAKEDMIGYMLASGVKMTVKGPDGKPMSAADLKKAKVTVMTGSGVEETNGVSGYDPIERK